MVKHFAKYGANWPQSASALEVEMACIRRGGSWKDKAGNLCGLGLFHHYKEMQRILWPRKKWHRWNNLLLKEFTEHKMIGVMGPASSGKTHEAAAFGLCTYFVFPEDTTVMVSSTDSRSLELRVWGEVKKYWAMARHQFSWLDGNEIGSKQMITTDGREAEGRDFRNGIVGIPCVVGGTYVGLGKYVGIKNTRIILIADEAQFMHRSFFDAIANLNKNPGFQCIALGNPKERNDALGLICEPADEDGGWDNVDEAEKTKVWRTRFANGRCVQLVGTDSPNFEVPPDQPPPFPFLITRQAIEDDIKFYGRDSLQVSMMNLGMMPKETTSRRVITRAMCVKFAALDEPKWAGPKTKIFAIDAAYGSVGGDRCVGGEVDFGPDTDGKQILAMVGAPLIIPVSGKLNKPPEEQIAEYVSRECQARGIPPENVFYDATGRGSLGTYFARVWSAGIVPVEFGGKASSRPVANDLFVLESNGARRQKRCDEHYSKFVTELWFSIRYAIEAGQFRSLNEDVMAEGCGREWKIVAGNKIEIETKEEMKLRMGRSPDLFDMLATAVEGARRKGFKIERIGGANLAGREKWLDDLKKKADELRRKNHLTYK
jgi:hypothetical protein